MLMNGDFMEAELPPRDSVCVKFVLAWIWVGGHLSTVEPLQGGQVLCPL